MIKRFKIILIIFTAILIYCNAYAQVPIEDPNATIELPNKKLAKKGMHIEGPITSISAGGLLLASFDSNYNFQIDLNEFNNAKLHIFNIADTDKSGVISPFELEDWRKTALGSLDAPPGNLSFDKDYDQRITKNEFNKTLISIFESGDKNNDGILKFSELVNVFEISNRMVTTTGNESNNWK
ncbi:hypothetical protein OAS62_01455 [Hellea sp.]|nr:hypothetical protein [Hellea sp.]MDC1088428.1 hypothetical protein [Hellea sp.]